jgi:ABC-type sugar transport system permease subunit
MSGFPLGVDGVTVYRGCPSHCPLQYIIFLGLVVFVPALFAASMSITRRRATSYKAKYTVSSQNLIKFIK